MRLFDFLWVLISLDIASGAALTARGLRRRLRSLRPKAAVSATGPRVALSALVFGVVAAVIGGATYAGFSATTSNPDNSLSAASIDLTDNDSGSAMLALSNAVPGSTDTSCIQVTYTGGAPSTVRLYGTTTGTGLDQYLDLTVTRGSGATGFDNCSGFTADATNYLGSGNGVIYTGTLQGYPDSYAAGIVDPVSGSPESWTDNENHQYKFVVTVQDNQAAEGLNATQTFTWEARTS